MSLSSRAQKTLVTDPATAQIFRALSNKYSSSNPKGIIILGVAENSLLSDRLAEFFNSSFSLTPYQLTYGDGFTGSIPLRNALAGHLNETLHPIAELAIKPEEVVVAAGVTALIDMVAWGVTDAGEGVLLSRPAYSGFEPDLLTRSGTVPVFVDLEGEEFFGSGALGKHEEALKRAEEKGIKIRALLLCNPHNPLGKAYPPEILDEYLKFCARHNLHLITDEVYALSSYSTPYNTEAVDFKSVLSLPSLSGPGPIMPRENIHLLYGMSKDFSSNGLRIGCLITRHEDLRNSLMAVGRFPWASSASERLWHKFLTDTKFKAQFLEDNSAALGKGYLKLRKFLEARGVPFEEGTKYGFFLWVNFEKWCGFEEGESKDEKFKKERELSGRLLDAGVWCATGGTFASEHPGWFRVTFSIEEDVLDLALKRLGGVLDGVEKGSKVGDEAGDKDIVVDAEDVALKIGGMDLRN